MYNPIPNRKRSLSFAMILGLGVTLAFLWLLSAGPLPLARADSFNVTKFTDSADGTCDGDCSLREAIIDANTNLENDTITLGTGTYVMTITGTNEDAAATGDLDITDVLTITGDGPGQTIIDANNIDRVFEIHYGASTVVISGVTIINGNVTGDGGGIYHYGDNLILINTDVSSNTADYGGGIFVGSSNATLNGGQVRGNSATYDGGGVYVEVGDVTLSGGQIVSNSVTYYGGGVYVGDATLIQTGTSTIAYNSAQDGGGLYVGYGSATRTHHSVGKGSGETNHVERWNNTLRQRLARFVRKTLSFSKSETYHEAALKRYLHYYNTEWCPISQM